jgi:hypothetical protein
MARPPNDKETVDARVGYQVATSIWASQADVGHARYNVMMIANSIFLGVIGLALTRIPPMRLLAVVLAGFGFWFCILWLHAFKRGYAYGIHLVRSARELEKYLGVVKTLSTGGQLIRGEEVKYDLKDADKSELSLKYDWFVRLGKTESASSIAICSFMALYLSIILWVLLLWNCLALLECCVLR